MRGKALAYTLRSPLETPRPHIQGLWLGVGFVWNDVHRVVWLRCVDEL